MIASRVPSHQGMWPWLLQRVTGVLLILFVGLHFWIEHYAIATVDFTSVTTRLNSAVGKWWVGIDSCLLVLVVYHALNGTRTVLFDYALKPVLRPIISWAFFLLGVAMCYIGLQTIHAF